jgi:hypothetical protein
MAGEEEMRAATRTDVSRLEALRHAVGRRQLHTHTPTTRQPDLSEASLRRELVV